MINVAFFPPMNRAWMGGVNYYKNLFFAISVHGFKEDICAISFVGKNTPRELIEESYLNSKVVRSSLFDRWSFLWFCSRVFIRVFGYDPLLHALMLKYRVQVVSHATPALPKSFSKVGWIPDFQHVYLPEFFSSDEIESRNKEFCSVAVKSDFVFLSSNDAVGHYKKFFPSELHHKARVLRFVSQVDHRYFEFDNDVLAVLLGRYGIRERFIYIPNQIWKHKNHMAVLEAAKVLLDKGMGFSFVFTGHKYDYRDPGLYESLEEYVLSNGLSDNVIFLGSIPYVDVMALLRFSIAVVNPSLFEGWSSTVEECKSAGKRMILSDIPVHREQFPEAVFFNPHSSMELAEAIESISMVDPDVCSDSIVLKNKRRTEEYFYAFCATIKSLIKD
ncbi:glycosyltransferase [Pseudomonas sp. SH1-B]